MAKQNKAIKISKKHLLGIQDLSISDVNHILSEAKQFIALAKKSNNRNVQDLLAKIPNYTQSTYSVSKGWFGGRYRGEDVSVGEYIYNMVKYGFSFK